MQAISREAALKGGAQKVTQLELERHNQRLDRAKAELQEAVHMQEVAQRARAATQTKTDLCFGRIQSLLQAMEWRAALRLSCALRSLCRHADEMLVKGVQDGFQQVAEAAAGIDVTRELRELVESSYGKNTPLHARIDANSTEPVAFAKHLAHGGFEMANAYLRRGERLPIPPRGRSGVAC